MTQVTPKGNLFDKSFDIRGRYVAQLKSGLKVCYVQRTELWKDKTACYWVTLELWKGEDLDLGVSMEGEIIFSDGIVAAQFDVRLNEISAIWEI